LRRQVNSARSALRRLAREQGGFSLIELLTAAALLTVILGAVLSLLDTTQEIAPQDQERAEAIREAQVGIHAMTRELRSAYQLDTTGPYYLSARVIRGGNAIQVAYDCAGSASNPTWGKCLRTVLSGSGSGGPPSELVKAFYNTTGAGGPPIFTYTTRADGTITYVDVNVLVVVRARSNGRYTYRVPLNDGVYLRNLDG
jgi:prepilin-type N-terminal cleavage/methylation domain-containing protein